MKPILLKEKPKVQTTIICKNDRIFDVTTEPAKVYNMILSGQGAVGVRTVRSFYRRNKEKDRLEKFYYEAEMAIIVQNIIAVKTIYDTSDEFDLPI